MGDQSASRHRPDLPINKAIVRGPILVLKWSEDYVRNSQMQTSDCKMRPTPEAPDNQYPRRTHSGLRAIAIRSKTIILRRRDAAAGIPANWALLQNTWAKVQATRARVQLTRARVQTTRARVQTTRGTNADHPGTSADHPCTRTDDAGTSADHPAHVQTIRARVQTARARVQTAFSEGQIAVSVLQLSFMQGFELSLPNRRSREANQVPTSASSAVLLPINRKKTAGDAEDAAD